MEIIKCHGSGNEFVLVDELDIPLYISEEQRRNIVKCVCDRQGEIGADGVLFVQKSDSQDARMRIFNADGTEPEMCGNGLRCVGRYVMERLAKECVRIQTMKAAYTVKESELIYKDVVTVEIELDTVDFNPSSLPIVSEKEKVMFESLPELSDNMVFSAVSITNPHLVAMPDKIEEKELVEVGEKANNCKELLPKGVNVNFVRIIDEDSMYVKTYERGVGLTMSCGTGMTASSVVSCIKYPERLNRVITVFNDGGAIRTCVSVDDNNNYRVRFIGNATYMYTADIEVGDEIKFIEDKTYFKEEEKAYNKFLQHTKSIIK